MELNQTKSESLSEIMACKETKDLGPPIRPRCLASIPADIEEILAAFHNQEKRS